MLMQQYNFMYKKNATMAASCSLKYFCIGAILIFVGSVLLCALGFTVVLPHQATKHWPGVWCNVTSANYNLTYCACDQQATDIYENCLGKYPCLQIHVIYGISNSKRIIPSDYKNSTVAFESSMKRNVSTRYNTHAYNNTKNANGMMDSNSTTTAMLYRYWNDAYYNTCSLYECGDEEWNIKETNRFRKKWGKVGKVYQCFYDPENPSKVILERTSRNSMIHALVWPAISLTTGASIWIGLCLGCWKIEPEDKYAQPKTSRSAVVY